MKARDGLGKQRCAGQHVELVTRCAGRKPESRNRIGDDDPLERWVGKCLGRPLHEETVRGERKSEKRETGKSYERVERVVGSFVRRFTLPETANTEQIKARQTNGVLEITIPKQPQVQPRRISIDA